MSNNISAVRDIVIVGGIAVAVFLLWKPADDAKKVIADTISNVTNYATYISKGGALKDESDRVAEEQRIVKSDIGTQETYHGLPNPFNIPAYDVPAKSPYTPPSTSYVPNQPAYQTPVYTENVEKMLFAPAPDRPDVQIIPDWLKNESANTQKYYGYSTDSVPRVDSGSGLKFQIQPISIAPAASVSTKLTTAPLSSMTPETASASGYKYSGAVGWYK